MTVCRQLDFDNNARKSVGPSQIYVNERHWAICGVIVSCCVLVSKVIYMYGDTIYNAFLSPLALHHGGQAIITAVHDHAIASSCTWLPLLFGFLATYITWMTVYLDSDVPGVCPPSPLSPQKYKSTSGHTFHLNYVFAILIGVLVTAYMYTSGIQLQYSNN